MQNVQYSGLLIGRFYFKLTINGNLIGEFSNRVSMQVFTESATRDTIFVPDTNLLQNFVGDFHITWREEQSAEDSELTIELRVGAPQLVSLTWQKEGTIYFRGEGMLCGDILMGDYYGINDTTQDWYIEEIDM